MPSLSARATAVPGSGLSSPPKPVTATRTLCRAIEDPDRAELPDERRHVVPGGGVGDRVARRQHPDELLHARARLERAEQIPRRAVALAEGRARDVDQQASPAVRRPLEPHAGPELQGRDLPPSPPSLTFVSP